MKTYTRRVDVALSSLYLRSTTRQARRRGLQNKSILNDKQRELIICNPKSILNILPRSVNNATLSIFTSSGRREHGETPVSPILKRLKCL